MGFGVIRGRSSVLAALSSLLVSSACGGGDEQGKASPGESRASESAVPDGPYGPRAALAVRSSFWSSRAKIELVTFEKQADKVVLARFRIVNGTESDYPISTSLTGDGTINQAAPKAVDPSAASGISLVDGRNARQYFPLNDADGECLCTRYSPFPSPVRPGETMEVVAAFPAPPKDVRALNVLFPHAPPFLDVPLTSAKARAVTFDPDQRPIDPVATRKAPPLVLPITGSVETGEGAEDDDGESLNVRLATDVLFATNKADLNDRAHGALKAVAAKIDKSPGSTVKVDGHTDSTGDDEINGPLSTRRAEAVKTALAALVKRPGVTFLARGHGSASAVASNSTEEGRRKNRRVTVTFTRPVESPATATKDPGLLEPFPRPVIGRATLGKDGPDGFSTTWPKSADLEVNSLRRDSSGLVTLVFTVNNTDKTTALDPDHFTDLSGPYQGMSTSGVVLHTGDRRIRVLHNSYKQAVGTPDFNNLGPGSAYKVHPEDSQPFWATFKAPADVTTVTVKVPGFTPVENVPIT